MGSTLNRILEHLKPMVSAMDDFLSQDSDAMDGLNDALDGASSVFLEKIGRAMIASGAASSAMQSAMGNNAWTEATDAAKDLATENQGDDIVSVNIGILTSLGLVKTADRVSRINAPKP